MIVAPGYFSRNAWARSAVMKSPETNSPVPSMKKQRSASPSQAMPTSARSATTRSEERRVGKECRSLCDWSSDVCSSDLRDEIAGDELAGAVDEEAAVRISVPGDANVGAVGHHEIGRASCRERV